MKEDLYIIKVNIYTFKKARSFTDKSWENFVKKENKKVVDLTGCKNNIPDFLTKPFYSAFFIECKCYQSVETLEEAMKAWKKKQPRQYKNFYKLIKKGYSIAIAFKLKDNKKYYYAALDTDN